MNESLRSILQGTAGLSLAAAVALALTVLRTANASEPRECNRLASLLLLGIVLQCLHFGEEFFTCFYERFPQRLGLPPWSSKFFVAFNLFWIVVWLLSVIGIQRNSRPAFFPAWFFAIAMLVNGLAHPALSLAARGYFPGLLTSPAVGIMGVLIWAKLWRVTRPSGRTVSAGNSATFGRDRGLK